MRAPDPPRSLPQDDGWPETRRTQDTAEHGEVPAVRAGLVGEGVLPLAETSRTAEYASTEVGTSSLPRKITIENRGPSRGDRRPLVHRCLGDPSRQHKPGVRRHLTERCRRGAGRSSTVGVVYKPREPGVASTAWRSPMTRRGPEGGGRAGNRGRTDLDGRKVRPRSVHQVHPERQHRRRPPPSTRRSPGAGAHHPSPGSGEPAAGGNVLVRCAHAKQAMNAR